MSKGAKTRKQSRGWKTFQIDGGHLICSPLANPLMISVGPTAVMIVGGKSCRYNTFHGIIFDAKTHKKTAELRDLGGQADFGRNFSFSSPQNQHHVSEEGTIYAMVEYFGRPYFVRIP